MELLLLSIAIWTVAITLPLTAVEGWLIRRICRWPWKSALVTALLANLLSTALGVTTLYAGILAGLSGEPRDIGLTVWAACRTWVLFASGIWLAYYGGAVLLETAVLHARSRRTDERFSWGRSLKVSAAVNALVYVILAPFWFVNEAPDISGAVLVHRTHWTPDSAEPFVYEDAHGDIRVATIHGEQIGRLVVQARPSPSRWIAYATDADRALLSVFTIERDPRLVYSTPSAKAAFTARLLGRFDLRRLSPEQLESVRAGARLGFPEHETNNTGPPVPFCKDGTLAKTARHQFGWGGGRLYIYRQVPPEADPARWPLRHAPGFAFGGFIPPWYRLTCRSPHVLPGGRYVLFECSGEIMVLDVDERKVVSLFRGRNPVALASLAPQEGSLTEDAPEAE